MSTADPVAAFRHREPGGYVRPDPDAMAAVAALERCLRMRDYAGAAQLVRQRKVADGLGILAAMARRSWAEQAYWRSVAEWRADHEATLRARLERDVAEIVALVAEAVTGAEAEARRQRERKISNDEGERAMSERFESREALAGKIEWEGGLMEALDYGITTDMMPEGDAELTEAWAKLEASFRETSKLADAVEELLAGDDAATREDPV